MAQPDKRSSEILNSWKEIASYLDRGIRTAQRWERELQLPVRRIGKGKRSPVFAIASELNFWRTTAALNSKKPAPQILTHSSRNGGGRESALEVSQELITRSRELVRMVPAKSFRGQ